MKVREFERKVGITKSPEFNKKTLATHALNVGLLCGHGCAYCSTPSLIRTHDYFKKIGKTSFEVFGEGGAVVDPSTPDRIDSELKKLKPTDVLMISTTSDCWSPEAQLSNLGRRILEKVLVMSDCQVRILTKNAAIVKEFDLIVNFKDRVRLGLSITGPVGKEHLVKILEPNASLISERFMALRTAHGLGIKTFGKLCPVLPGIGDDRSDFEEMIDMVLSCDPEAIWTEPLNPRGPGISRCVELLQLNGHRQTAAKFDMIRNAKRHGYYVFDLINMANDVAKSRGCFDKLKILVYANGEGWGLDSSRVIWLNA